MAKKKNKKSKSDPFFGLDQELLTKMLDMMIKSRVLEERLIKIYKAGEAFFWIGSPGEEAFGVPLGLIGNVGQGPEFDYYHLHYRGTPTLVAMGMPMIDSIRLIMNKSTDKSTGGRNFCNHYCYPNMNVAPVTSPIEIQYPIAVGTALSQSRNKNHGISIVTGGDAGTAEGDFASSLIWSSRPSRPLPMLMTVQNNSWGISTDYDSQHGESAIHLRGRPFNIPTCRIDGNNPAETYVKLKEAYEYVKEERKPFLLEAMVSRLYGHSSADGANFNGREADCVSNFSKQLIQEQIVQEDDVRGLFESYDKESRKAFEQVRKEQAPEESTVWDHMFVDNENGDWRKF